MKGDNNPVDDTTLYPDGRGYVPRSEILGFVRGYIPLLGWIVIGIQDIRRVWEAVVMLCGGIVGSAR
jgi:signal peptidase